MKNAYNKTSCIAQMKLRQKKNKMFIMTNLGLFTVLNDTI
jgi:hypothetical protein